MVLLCTEKTFFRGAAGYETARRSTVWNGLLPQRFPDVIVQAHDTEDVVAAIRHARANGYQVGVRSGGHSWAASHLRDGGLLLDVSRLDHCTVEPDQMIAYVGPGKVASVFATELDAQGLFFPAGHCEGICLGGYLLQGGYGWNSPVMGPACESVLGLEVVTADGEQIYCDPENHPDMYWAARGSGPGFFGVVTSFKLRVHPRPAVWGTCLYMYPIEVADEVFTWARSIVSEIDDRVELQMHTARSFPGAGLNQPGITIASPVFADSEEEAVKALAPLSTCPVIDKAIVNLAYAPTTLANWYSAVMTSYPGGIAISPTTCSRRLPPKNYCRASAGSSKPCHRIPRTSFSRAGRRPRNARTWCTAWKTRSTWRSIPSGRIRPTTNGTGTGPRPTWRRCRTWQLASRSPTRICAGVRRDSSPNRIWHASTRCARSTTRMVDSTAGWAASANRVCRAAGEPNRRSRRFTSKEVNGVSALVRSPSLAT